MSVMSDWREDAACRGLGADIFFPDSPSEERHALEVCAVCPVTDACLQVALAMPSSTDRFGVFGGTTPGDRRRLRRRERIMPYVPIALRWNPGRGIYEEVAQ